MDKGLVHIYTGDGKGKTTSSVGLATRALGHGRKVLYVYFHKIPEKYGYNEINSLEKLGAVVRGVAKGHPSCDRNLNVDDLRAATISGLAEIEKMIGGDDYDLLILDEAIISVRDGFLPEENLIEFIDDKPAGLELVITGRGATEAMIQKADYVSRITKVKHPYDRKTPAREGIEF